MSTVERQREQLVQSMMRHFDRLSALRNFLTPAQTFFIAEELRNLADTLDQGFGDRLRHVLPRKSGIFG